MKNLLPIFSLLFLIALTPACKTAKSAQGDSIKLKPKSAKFLKKRLVQNQVSAEWVSARAKIIYSDQYGTQRFTSFLRFRKDSLLWMNFKKAGAEGARMQITKDSIYIIDRLNKKYTIKDFSFIQKSYGLATEFEGVQAMILGNPIFFSTDLEASIDKGNYVLSGKNDRYTNDYWMAGLTFLLDQMMIEDYRDNKKISVEFGDYQGLDDGNNFSYFRHFNLFSKEFGEVSIKIQLSKVELNVPKIIRFEIPERYTKME